MKDQASPREPPNRLDMKHPLYQSIIMKNNILGIPTVDLLVVGIELKINYEAMS